MKFSCNLSNLTFPNTNKNGIEANAKAPAIPNAPVANEPFNVPSIAFNPLPKPVTFSSNLSNLTFPIKAKNGIDGNENNKAGPANAVLKIPFPTPL